MKKLFLALLLLASPAMAGKKYSFKDARLNDELDNNYREHSYPTWVNAKGSSATITSIQASTVSAITGNFTNLNGTAISGSTITATSNLITPSINGTFIGLGRNRFINGDMSVDQRNEGALKTMGAATVYSVDRWGGFASVGVFKCQRLATTPPAGFLYYVHITVTTADATPAAGSFYQFFQSIEGLNVRDFKLGSSSAVTFTTSFWVRSNLTGTFSGGFVNFNASRCYPFTYSISSANTWEYKTITVAGDTTGTWQVDVTQGISIVFDIGSGSTSQGTAFAWVAANNTAVTGANKLITSTSNTLDITGVQLEIGNRATSFEYVPYPLLLHLCNRYYWKTFPTGTAPAQNTGTVAGSITYITVAGGVNFYGPQIYYPTAMRISPTITTYSPSDASAKWFNASRALVSGAATTFNAANTGFYVYDNQIAGDAVSQLINIHATADADF